MGITRRLSLQTCHSHAVKHIPPLESLYVIWYYSVVHYTVPTIVESVRHIQADVCTPSPAYDKL